MPIKAGWQDYSLTLWDFSRSNKHCIQLSTNKYNLYLSPISAFRSSCPELFCKKGVLKIFAKFTAVFSGTGISCEFCQILKKPFFRKTPAVAASGIRPNRDLLINWQLRHEYVQFLTMVRLHFHMYFPQNNHYLH